MGCVLKKKKEKYHCVGTQSRWVKKLLQLRENYFMSMELEENFTVLFGV